MSNSVNKSLRLTRRKTIALLSGAGAAMSLGMAAWQLRARSRRSRLLPAFQMELDSLRKVAEEYLQDHPDERNLKVLESELLKSLSKGGASKYPKVAIQEAVSRDFNLGDTVSLDGWVLSRTEVRLWVLCAGPNSA